MSFARRDVSLRQILTGDALGVKQSDWRRQLAAIREESGVGDLFVACYANDYVGYVVPQHSYDEGGYEAGVTPFGPEAEGIISDASVELLREVMDGD